MKNLTPELIAKAKTAKSAEELLEMARANGTELTEADAKTYYEQLSANGAVSDDELDAVVGGCGTDYEPDDVLRMSTPCPKCGGWIAAVRRYDFVPLQGNPIHCINCHEYIGRSFGAKGFEKVGTVQDMRNGGLTVTIPQKK